MPILSQILGSSFGRAPQTIGGTHMMQPFQQPPPMYAAPTHIEMQGADGGARVKQPPSPGGGAAVDGDVPSMIANMLARRGLHTPGVGPSSPTAPAAPPTAGAAPNGVMGSIASAFNGGAGGGMDMSKLLSMLPMIAG